MSLPRTKVFTNHVFTYNQGFLPIMQYGITRVWENVANNNKLMIFLETITTKSNIMVSSEVCRGTGVWALTRVMSPQDDENVLATL